jgi:hypothetical protein
MLSGKLCLNSKKITVVFPSSSVDNLLILTCVRRFFYIIDNCNLFY